MQRVRGHAKRVSVHTWLVYTCWIFCNLRHVAGQVFHIRWRKSIVNTSQSPTYTGLKCLLQSSLNHCLFLCSFFRSRGLDKGQEKDSAQLKDEAVLCPHGLVLCPPSYRAFSTAHVQGLPGPCCQTYYVRQGNVQGPFHHWFHHSGEHPEEGKRNHWQWSSLLRVLRYSDIQSE